MIILLVQKLSLEVKYGGYTAINKLEVLAKVKHLVTLTDKEVVTVKMVADYYEVPVETVRSTIKYHKDEIESDGYKVLKSKEVGKLREICLVEGQLDKIPSKANMLSVLSKRAVLRIGMLLRDSEVAKRVRTALLDIEEAATTEQKVELTMKVKQLKKILDKLDDDMDVLILWKNATCYRVDKVAILDDVTEFKMEDNSIKKAIVLSKK